MAQTTVTEFNEVALDGMPADSAIDKDFQSRIAEGAVGFGRVVVDGTTVGEQCKLPDGAGQIADAIGIAVSDTTRATDQAATSGEYADEDTVSIQRKRRIWVKVEDAVAVNGDVFVNFQNGAEGQCRSDVAGGDAEQLPGAKYKSAAGAGELALVELD